MSQIEPLLTDGLADYHCHCDYSTDAKGTIDEYCQAALQRGLAEICFTTHFDSNPLSDGLSNFIRVRGEKKPAAVENLAPYVDDILAAHERFYPHGLMVKLGLEFGWYPNCEEKAQRVREAYDFEYFLAGIHEINNICFCCSSTYEQCFANLSLEAAVENYYQQVANATKTGLFHTVAHLDYYRKYGFEFYGSAVNQAHRPFLAEVFAALKAAATSIEVNTSARRKGFENFFPQAEIINAAKRAEVDVLVLGSDAHSPEQVGWEFDEAAHLIPSAIGGCDD